MTYAERKAAGLCVYPSCETPPEPGCVRCRRHLDAVNADKNGRVGAYRDRSRLTRRCTVLRSRCVNVDHFGRECQR